MIYNTDKETLQVPINGITIMGRLEAIYLLTKWDLPMLPADWQWVWKVGGKGEYVGMFPKRVAKWLYQKHATKPSKDQLGELGTKVSAHSERNAEYTFDFTHVFDWQAGDFGDKGSCFWTCHVSAKDMLYDNDARAVRFYNYAGGYARAWVAPYGNGVVVFNGYGLETLSIARILSHKWGAYYKKVTLDNNQQDSGTLFINGGSGYFVGPQDEVMATDHIDLEWEDINDNSNCCSNCDSRIEEGDGYFTHYDWYCEGCHSDLFFLCEGCEGCEEYFSNDEHHLINDTSLCDACLLDNYTECYSCNEYCANKDISCGPDGEDHCVSCHLDTVDCCEVCETDYMCDELTNGPDGVTRCKCCYKKDVATCGDCGEDMLRDDCKSDTLIEDAKEVDGETLCVRCTVMARGLAPC